jgi:hypothetical protein
VLSNVVNSDGNPPKNLDDKIVLFLINVEEETTLKNNFHRSPNSEGKFDDKNPTAHYNLDVLFCANFTGEKYSDGLAYLSAVIRYFQRNRVIRPIAPEHPLHNSKLLFEMVKLDYSQMSHLWSAVGSKLMPSLLYRVRLLAFRDTLDGAAIPSILQTKTRSKS